MKNWHLEIVHIAEKDTTNEVCGFIFLGKDSPTAVECVNVHEDPVHNFRISEEDTKAAFERGFLLAYFHSHNGEDEKLSENDILASENAGLPVICYSTQTGRFSGYFPKSSMPILEGRSFLLSFQDCASIVTDYYLTVYGVRLPWFPRTREMLKAGMPDLYTYLAENNFKKVGMAEVGDILLFSTATNGLPNHVGIYHGDGMILEQRVGEKSRVAPLTSEPIAIFRRPGLQEIQR